MDQRQLDKERIRLTREIAMLENQFDAATRGKEEKIGENKQIKEEIAQLEEENKGLEEETRRLDEEIASLDEEFKQAQIDSGRLRREIKINIERTDGERKKAVELRNTIAKLEKNLETLKREIKQEIDDRRSLEAKLRKTNSHIESMKNQKVAGITLADIVTKKLEKQDWYRRVEEPLPAFASDMEESVEVSAVTITTESEPKPVAEPPKEKPKDDGGIDFSVD